MPIAGELLDRKFWTQTTLDTPLPAGPLDWVALFGRDAPRVVDLGCGNGRFLLQSAVWRPTHDHVGLDLLPLVIRYATRRANQRGLRNVRWTVIDALSFLQRHAVAASLDEVHCYHPQPYHDPAERHRRVFTAEFLEAVRSTLKPGGAFFLQTDNADYWRDMRPAVEEFFDLEVRDSPWADAPQGRTRRELMARRQGLAIYRGVARHRPPGAGVSNV